MVLTARSSKASHSPSKDQKVDTGCDTTEERTNFEPYDRHEAEVRLEYS